MKTIIFAGGWGTRLDGQEERLPKPMVQIGNKPILWHIMKTYSHYGYNEFVICLGVKAEAIKNYFYNYEKINADFTIDIRSGEIEYHNKHEETNWKITLVDTGLNTLKGGRLKRIEPYLDSEINMVTYGDGVANININELVEFHKSHGKIITISGVHPPARFGEIIEKNNLVVSFEEKPQTSVGLINGGYMVFNKELFNYLNVNENCDFEIGPLEKLAKKSEVMVYKHEGSWECMDHGRDVVYLNKLWSKSEAFWKIW
jgi:glucose-1-phosphate cytidylyltransferase